MTADHSKPMKNCKQQIGLLPYAFWFFRIASETFCATSVIECLLFPAAVRHTKTPQWSWELPGNGKSSSKQAGLV